MDKIYWGASPTAAEYDKEKFLAFCSQSPQKIKEACQAGDGRLKHIISAEHFDISFLETICTTAQAARKIHKTYPGFLKGLLPYKSVVNYFKQPSSRTFLSFSSAEAKLGMQREEVRDISTSSEVKGESEKDSLRTISSYFDAVICRHPSDSYHLFAAWVMNNSDRGISYVNAGSGKGEHPTQGILDYYTIRESMKGNMEGKIIAYVGDCARGRTVHSLAKIMSLHPGTEAHFIAPPELQIDRETEQYIRERGTTVFQEENAMKEVVAIADVVYMTRIQDEHGGAATYDPQYIFTEDMLKVMKPGAILMHPMPKREEIDPAIDYLKKDPGVMYWREQRNGMWIRVAVLAYIFKADQKIRDFYHKKFI